MAIRVHTEVGGWYGDCTLEGDYVSLHRAVDGVKGYLIVNGNRLELPDTQSNLLFVVCKRWNGQLLIAGQGQEYSNWLYINSEWKDLGSSFATLPLAFGSSTLYIVVGPNQYKIYDLITDRFSDVFPRSIGVNGIRYIDFNQSPDGIVTGDETYGPTPFNLSQWSKNNDLVLGQSYIDGAIVLYNARYLIEPGDTQFLRLHRVEDNLAIAIVKMIEKSTVFYWLTVEDLKLFPIQFSADEKIKGPITRSNTLVDTSSDNSVIKAPAIVLGKKVMSNLPLLDKWMHEEFPQLLAAYIKTQGHAPEPDFEWACFQTYRRYQESDAWPFDKMLRHELGDDSIPVNP